jgi:hypothetical protein
MMTQRHWLSFCLLAASAPAVKCMCLTDLASAANAAACHMLLSLMVACGLGGRPAADGLRLAAWHGIPQQVVLAIQCCAESSRHSMTTVVTLFRGRRGLLIPVLFVLLVMECYGCCMAWLAWDAGCMQLNEAAHVMHPASSAWLQLGTAACSTATVAPVLLVPHRSDCSCTKFVSSSACHAA